MNKPKNKYKLCPKCMRSGFTSKPSEYNPDRRPMFTCMVCDNQWTCGTTGGEYSGNEQNMVNKISRIIPLCFKVTKEQKESIRKANEETMKFYNMKIEKYGWLNNPPKQLIQNLIKQVKILKQPGDDARFARLRGKMKNNKNENLQ